MREVVRAMALSVVCVFVTACSEPAETERQENDSGQLPEQTAAPSGPAAAQDKAAGQFKEDRVWPGMAEGLCGARLRVAAIDGSETEYWPPALFFQQYEHEMIVQNESARPAADVIQLLDESGAERIRLKPCDGEAIILDRSSLNKWPGLLVHTGKGLIKLVKDQDGVYLTMLRKVKRIEFLPATVAADESQSGAQPAMPQ